MREKVCVAQKLPVFINDDLLYRVMCQVKLKIFMNKYKFFFFHFMSDDKKNEMNAEKSSFGVARFLLEFLNDDDARQ